LTAFFAVDFFAVFAFDFFALPLRLPLIPPGFCAMCLTSG
jgi:hypothetical protein